ncbi:serine/threonine-protein kinase [Streptomyces sp. NPDC051776]|uniref:serine/threonine-protein kinase n=1 Tax=Streptomyces sp. NPDC051776 TaxID=3155414 RepID=UPI00343ED2AF
MHPLEADDPRAIGPYRLLRRLGAGGMGRVYLGRSAGGRTVAVKVVHPHHAGETEFRARFRREIESARRVGGDWTAPVLDADPEASLPWVATGYVAGPDLSRAVSAVGPLPTHTVRTLGAGLAEALAAVHALGLVHRDVKPSNVLLTVDGPRLIDFGIARATDGTASLTATGVSIGSPGYMSPEQILGHGVTHASDVFSLGAVLAFAATGETPFPGDSSASLLYKVVHEEPELGAALTDGLRELVTACLAKDPADRPTPQLVARRLGGGTGAQGLARSGWLPGPLVEQVSRRAVELLGLEAETGSETGPETGSETSGAGPGAAAERSGPVTLPPAEFPSGGRESGSGPATPYPPAAATVGAYGPPHPSYADRSAAGGSATNGSAADGAADSYADRAAGSYADGTADADARNGAARGGGRAISVSATATAAPPPAGARGPRRLSCTLVLSVAAALAVVTTTAYLLGLMPGAKNGEDNTADSAGRPSASASSSAAASSVPTTFLGTWEGDLTSENGIPGGLMTITIEQGKVGQKVGSGDIRLAPLRCRSLWRLVKARPDELVLDSRFEETEGQALCSQGSTEERLTLRPDGTLRYTAKDDPAGNPTGTLRKLARHTPEAG